MKRNEIKDGVIDMSGTLPISHTEEWIDGLEGKRCHDTRL